MVRRIYFWVFFSFTVNPVVSWVMGSQEVMVSMHDGVALRTTIRKPAVGSYPVVLTRGYAADWPDSVAEKFTEAGYVFVVQQCRGNGGNDGSRFFPDDKDGYDCIEWISQQSWCNGKVAMWGGSYWGITQWRAALSQHPTLKAIVPGFATAELWKDGYWSHGALHLKMTTQGRAIPGQHSLEEWKRMLMFLPLIDMDGEFWGRENILWNDYISHSYYDDYWKEIGMREGNKYTKINIPVYLMAGFRDYYAGAAFESFNALTSVGGNDEIRVRVSDSGHSGAPNISETLRWLDYVLKGENTGIQDEPPVKIQVRGAGWRYEHQWPPEGTQLTKFYFHSFDGLRKGILSTEIPGNEPPCTYTYDPMNPVPTLGANGSHFEIPGLISVGQVDQQVNEDRPDVLVFTTDIFQDDIEVIGPVEVKLYASSSATDTDFTAKLLDVHPDGRALNVTEGIVRARFHKSLWEPPSLITPGYVYEFTIELLPVAIRLANGHRLRVHISSSNWPLWDRNLNTGNPIGMDTDMQIAHQTLYHDRVHPSCIVLPLLPQTNDSLQLRPKAAHDPVPDHKAKDVSQSPILRWHAGTGTLEHDVYFGDDADEVADATRTAGTYRGRWTTVTFDPGPLGRGRTYYWRVDEVNDLYAEPQRPGLVWSFTTADLLTVDTFEDYSDTEPPCVLDTWQDGSGVVSEDNGTGSIIECIAQTRSDGQHGKDMQVVHSGNQAMLFLFDNRGYTGKTFYSEVSRLWNVPQDWGIQGATDVKFWFKGGPLPGSIRFDRVRDEYVMTGAGDDIWNQFDAFHFAYKELTGDGSITACIRSLVEAHAWAKAGVMMRESLEPDARHVMVLVTPENRVSFQHRHHARNACSAIWTNADTITLPHWIRLMRGGDTFRCEHSADGMTWLPINGDVTASFVDLAMENRVYVGLGLTSHTPAVFAEAAFSNVYTSGSVLPDGHWDQSRDIGINSNSPEPLYMALASREGPVAKVYHPDLEAVNSADWTSWTIPLNEFTDVNDTSVTMLTIGVGTPEGNKAGGIGQLMIDDVLLCGGD